MQTLAFHIFGILSNQQQVHVLLCILHCMQLSNLQPQFTNHFVPIEQSASVLVCLGNFELNDCRGHQDV